MLQDHEARRRSEIDAINGQVSERGRALGIATPNNDLVSAIVRARETNF
jgi:2-dehydropantoate 2-reductase